LHLPRHRASSRSSMHCSAAAARNKPGRCRRVASRA